jgi:methylenetetrahydrofolate reductase (NADH)
MPIFSKINTGQFIITIEVVPPNGNDPSHLLSRLSDISNLNFQAFSVASNPVAKPKMSALVFAHLLQQQLKKKAILHFTIRDHNQLSLQSELWGAKALGIDTVIAVTGDPSSAKSGTGTSTVGDLNVFELISLAQACEMETGAVLDYRPETNGLEHEALRLEKKADAGAQFIVTQPIYDEKTAKEIHHATSALDIPVIMGILPLLSHRHATFLHDKVDGIAVPKPLRVKMKETKKPLDVCIEESR